MLSYVIDYWGSVVPGGREVVVSPQYAEEARNVLHTRIFHNFLGEHVNLAECGVSLSGVKVEKLAHSSVHRSTRVIFGPVEL